jgi:hypothetical protein
MKAICTIVAVFLLLSSVHASTNETNQSVRDLGSESGAPVDAGFVFVNGRYVDAPYVVSRRGDSIFINEELIETPVPWPLPPEVLKTNVVADTKKPSHGRAGTWTKERVDTTLNYFKESYEKSLALGDVYYFFPPNSHVSGIKSSVHSMIESLLPILRSHKSTTDKEAELLVVKPAGFHDWQIRILAEQFSASDQLEKRIKNNETNPQPSG